MTEADALQAVAQRILDKARRIETAFDHLAAYDESCQDDKCECCATWRGLVADAVRIADGDR